MNDVVSGNMPDPFDRAFGALHDLPDVVRTKPTTTRAVTPLVGNVQTFVVQTLRQREMGDYIFLEHIDAQGLPKRFVIPPEVSAVIARQRDAVATMSRRKAARAIAQERQDQGIENPLLRPEVREKAMAGLARARAERKKKKKRKQAN